MSIRVATVVTIIIGKPVMYVCVAFGWPCVMHARPSVESCSLIGLFNLAYHLSSAFMHMMCLCA